MADTLNGWTITKGEGVVSLTKGSLYIETTFDPREDYAAVTAYEHAIAQAWSLDNPGEDAKIRDAGTVTRKLPSGGETQVPYETVMKQTIRNWELGVTPSQEQE